MRLLGFNITRAPKEAPEEAPEPAHGPVTAKEWERALHGWRPLTADWWTVIAEEAFAQQIITKAELERLQDPIYTSQGAIEPIMGSPGRPSIYDIAEPLWRFYERMPYEVKP